MTVKIYFDPTGKLVVDNAGTASAAWLARRSQIELCVDRLTAGTITSKIITLGVTDTMGDVKIQAGKTDFTNTETGFILGMDDSDSNYPKFYIGNTTAYLNWTGTALNIAGAISAGTIDIGGDDATSFHVDADGGIWSGASVANKATAPFRVSNAGALVATSATITGAITSTSGTIGGFTLSATALYAGTTTTRIQLDTSAGIHLGATAFADAPFRVSLAGALVATSATVTGAITASSGSVGSFTIGTYLYTGTKTAYNDANAGVHLGSDGLGIGNNVFTVSSAGALVATSATITGTVTSTAGTIGGFTLSSTALYAGATTTRIQLDTTSGIHLGATAFADAPFRVSLAGALTCTTATITGAITATSGSIGSFTIGTYLYTGSKTAYNDANAGVHLGSDGLGIGNNVFTVSSAGALVATSATITGVITANTGYLGGTSGWVISAGYIKDVAGIVGLSAVVTGGDDIRFWAGHATPASAPFRVTEAGVVTATSATITGTVTATAGTIGGFTLSSTALYAGATTTRIQLDTTAGIWCGATAFADAPFRVSLAGTLYCIGATVQTAASGARTVLSSTGIAGYDATTQRYLLSNDGSGWFGSATAFAWTTLGAVTATAITVQTAASGARIVMDTTAIKGYDATTQRYQLSADGSGWFGSSTALAWTTAGVLTCTGITVQSAASPSARVVIDSSYIAGYSDATVKQFYISAADGKAYFAGGNAVLSTLGLGFLSSGNLLYWTNAGNTGRIAYAGETKLLTIDPGSGGFIYLLGTLVTHLLFDADGAYDVGDTTNRIRRVWADNITVGEVATLGSVLIDAAGYLRLPYKTDTGDPAGGTEGRLYVNLYDNALRLYADGAWRSVYAW